MGRRPGQFTDATAIADTIIRRLGGKVVLGLPLGLGKANLIANALYQRAAYDASISLTILTALSLELPLGHSRLEERFIGPVRERVFGNCPELDYIKALRRGQLPPNIRVNEFFLTAGRWLAAPRVQQNYISSNYTDAAHTLIERGVNVVAQMVVRDSQRLSLSCNTDLTPDLLRARDAGDTGFLLVGEVNPNLPFMEGDSALPDKAFDYLLEGPRCAYTLFAPPKLPISTADYAAGFQIACLIPDGGTLQIGIGSIGDAVAQALIVRQNNNTLFKEITDRLSVTTADEPARLHHEPFVKGLFGLSEMLVDAFLPLIDAGVVKRTVDGALIQAAFFLGPAAFYKRLRNMSAEDRRQIQMKPVSWVNSLYRDEGEKRMARHKARFINNAMMATLQGAVISDALEDGRVVSGVGGQYDFVAQAFALEDARSVVALNATRMSGGRIRSNILWSYGNQSVPRHLRDVIVTEYGIADLRAKTDAEVIAAMLAICDSRFQNDLLQQAQRAGKIDRDYRIPQRFRNNLPARIIDALVPGRAAGSLQAFPFGSDFTDIEQRLLSALGYIKTHATSHLARLTLIAQGLLADKTPFDDELARLGLLKPQDTADRALRLLVLGALAKSLKNRA